MYKVIVSKSVDTIKRLINYFNSISPESKIFVVKSIDKLDLSYSKGKQNTDYFIDIAIIVNSDGVIDLDKEYIYLFSCNAEGKINLFKSCHSIENKPRKKILIVDDDPLTIELQKGLLSKDFEVSTCDNAFLSIDKSKSEEFDLILLDCLMPGINGGELAKIMKSDRPSSVLYGMTAGIDDKQKLLFESNGMTQVLNKPVSSRDVSRILSVNDSDCYNKKVHQNRALRRSDFSNFISKNSSLDDLLFLLNEKIGRNIDISLNEIDDDKFKRNLHSVKGTFSYINAEDYIIEVENIDKNYNDKSLIESNYALLSLLFKALRDIETLKFMDSKNSRNS
ncbi:response regulator [Vibrio lamellibrachiae]|uniref:response regulator n=1 Tax=Vibrio lamellibrachiae TaxID=2910253 RepID=UPI003D14C011